MTPHKGSFLIRPLAGERRAIAPLIVVLVFAAANFLQATVTPLTGDEALYAMHGLHLSPGFKDHPPGIGLLTRGGGWLLPGAAGVRVLGVLCHAVMLWLVFRLVKPVHLERLILILVSIPVIHIYGFLATPDVPFLLATICYLITWRSFLESQNARKAVLMGLCMAAMLWSKYSGVLVILFTWIAVPSLWKNRWLWVSALSGLLLFSPHLIWQGVNDFPSFRFHLVERAGEFRWSNTTDFLAGQFAIFNPLVLVTSLLAITRRGSKDAFDRSMRSLLGLTILFFFVMSARGRVEAHWTAPCVFPMLFLLFRQDTQWMQRRIARVVLLTFSTILIVLRVLVVYDVVPVLRGMFHRPAERIRLIHELAGNRPVCFMNSYQDPSLYMFYVGTPAHSIQNVEGAKNQYDWWQYNEAIHQQECLLVASYNALGFESRREGDIELHYKVYDDLPVLHAFRVLPERTHIEVQSGDTLTIPVQFTNNNRYPLVFDSMNYSLTWRFLMSYKKIWQQVREVEWTGFPDRLNPGETVHGFFTVMLDVPVGTYRCGIAARIDDLPQTYQSPWIHVVVRESP